LTYASTQELTHPAYIDSIRGTEHMQGLASLGYEVIDQPVLDQTQGLPQFQNAAEMLADFGRNGDTYIVHAAEGETVIPMEVLESNPRLKSMLFAQMQDMGIEPERYIVGNELNSINPQTGQPEFFLKKLFKGLKKVVKKLAPIVLPIVAPFLLPAMPMAFATGLGSLAGGLASGRNLKDSLKGALIAGGIAGLGNMAFRDGSFFGSKAAPTGQLGDVTAKQAFSLDNPFTAATPDAVNAAQAAEAARLLPQGAAVPTPAGVTESITRTPDLGTFGDSAFSANPQGAPLNRAAIDQASQLARFTEITGDGKVFNLTADATRPSLGQALKQTFTPGDEYGVGDLYSDYLSPSRASIQPDTAQVSAQAAQDAAKSIAETNAALTSQGLPALTDAATQSIVDTSMKSALAKATPGFLQKYGPLAATAVGTAAASDSLLGTNFFREQEAQIPGLITGETGRDYLERDPARYGFDSAQFFGGNPYYQALANPQQQADTGRVYQSAAPPVYTASNFVNPYLAPASQAVMGYRQGGEIVGPGTGTSDSIPALLSDGEFVVTRRAVENLGGGDRKVGARKMYDFMRTLENGRS
jgi:hypothetical protein